MVSFVSIKIGWVVFFVSPDNLRKALVYIFFNILYSPKNILYLSKDIVMLFFLRKTCFDKADKSTSAGLIVQLDARFVSWRKMAEIACFSAGVKMILNQLFSCHVAKLKKKLPGVFPLYKDCYNMPCLDKK